MKPQHNIHINTASKGDLRINVSNLSEGIHKYNLNTEAKNLEIDGRFTKTINVDVELDKSPNQMYVKADVSTDGFFECDRCLKGFEMKIHTKFDSVYMFKLPSDSLESDDEVKILNPETNHIELSEDVREFILLAIPVKILCAKDCAGLCPSCGTNLNEKRCSCNEDTTDNRWEPLSKLLKKTE